MNVSAVSVVAVALAVLLVGAAPPGAAAASVDGGVSAQQSTPETPTAANNTTVRHRNPDEAAGEETLAELRNRLAKRLSDRLSDNSLRVTEGEYDRARELLGEEYVDTLGKFADVAGERGESEATDEFERAGRTQRNFTDSVADYRKTEAAYYEAKRSGNETEARRLARELGRIAEDVRRQSNRLNRTYDRLGNDASVDFDETRERIETVRTDISESQAEIRRAELVATTLVVRTDGERASFTDPLTIDGRLTAVDGDPIDNRSITLLVGERRYTARTDASGSFSLAYRPTALPESASTVGVRYVPRPSSVYVADNRTVPIAVEQVNATVDFESVPERVSRGDDIAVTGRVRVDNRSIPNLPLTVRIDDRTVGANRTGRQGRFAVAGRLPVRVADGNQTVTVSAPDRAVAVTARSRSIAVESTPTNLTLSLSADGAAVTGAGRLTAAGEGVGGRTITLSVDGAPVRRTTTADDGTYRVRLARDEVRENTTVRARFDGSGTNLESANASAVFRTGSAGSGDGAVFEVSDGLFGVAAGPGGGGAGDASEVRSAEPDTPWSSEGVALGGAAALVGVAAGWYAVRRWWGRGGDPAAEAADEPAESSSDETGPSALELLTRGRVQDALLAAYRSVQQSVTPRLDDSAAVMTHRQFYAACRRSGKVPMEYLGTVNSAYERAVYSDNDLSFERAREAILAARHLVTETEDGEREP